ncbi:MAG: tetratricopeptide repeat protein [Phycisphaerae bacterium]|nr:tetratricopeptide repeat protein [Phycisphaerae bacterium]MDD5380234.1 tetratricopeptide repeat protein [Phycisphaerae bacterium]
MKKQIFLYLCCAFLFPANTFAEDYKSDHFIISSDLDPCFVEFVQVNADAYYENLLGQYFQTGWQKPLTIYYSKTQSDTQHLLDKNGKKTEVDYGFYDPDMPAIYTHRYMNDGELSGWGTLFHEIAHHFIRLNYRNSPTWFNEGLACFLGEQNRIVKGKLNVGRPNPWREQILRKEMEEGRRPNIKRLFASSTEQFNEWNLGCHFARALFYWLHETGQIEQYLKAVQEKGYELPVLEETVGATYGKINIELKKFIETNCYAGAYLKDGQQASDQAQKIQAFSSALELKPDYPAARLELAECYYRSKDYEKCRENLKPILEDPESVEYPQAAGLMANIYYNEKDYQKAIEYYNKAWEYADYYEYKHRTAYHIGNCYYHLKDPKNAKCWYEKFLKCNWEKEDMKTSADYARKYLASTTTADANRVKSEKNTKADANSVSNTASPQKSAHRQQQ